MIKYLAVAFSLLFAIIAFTFMPGVIDSFRDTITESHTNAGNITTGAGETTGNITLSEDLYMNRLSSITSLTSSLGADNEAAASYDEDTNALIISGLQASQSRIITAVYDYDSSADFPNSGQVVKAGPVIIILSLIVLVIAIPLGLIYLGYRRIKGGA